MGTPRIIFQGPDHLGAHVVWSTVDSDHVGRCEVKHAGKGLGVFPGFKEAAAEARYAVSPDGGYSEVGITPAGPGQRITHSSLLAWLMVVLFLVLPQITTAATYAYVVPKNMRVQEIKPEQIKEAPPSKPAKSKISLLAPPRVIDQYIYAVAQHHKVDPLLIRAMIQQESRFQVDAISPAGAQGLMQLMPGTARDLRVSDPFDPLENIFGGTKYIKSLLDQYHGDVALSLAAYNAGPGNVNISGGIPNFPETQGYVLQVLQGYLQLKNM